MLGVIADDLTGATDAACMIARRGLSVTQVIGVPNGPSEKDADAIIIALKSRSIPAHEAVELSLKALDWLQACGAGQIYFKYCSTFDSTPDGNIGPVAAAIAERLQQKTTLFAPGFPENGRTVYRGHMFVEDRLISESSLATHPLNPMTDPDLVRFLGQQSGETPISNLAVADLDAGLSNVVERMRQIEVAGGGFVIADTLYDHHIDKLAVALKDARFITGGSPLCGALADVVTADQSTPKERIAPTPEDGPALILAGSCSEATREQVERVSCHHQVATLDPLQLAENNDHLAAITERAADEIKAGRPAIVASTADPSAVQSAQSELGTAKAGHLVETALGHIAKALSERGVRVFIVAGGETSSAVAQALSVDQLAVGPEIAPGVPWTRSLSDPHYRLAFKSGNFGGPDFFSDALHSWRVTP